MNGPNSDWSDEDAVISGSATEADESSGRKKKLNNRHKAATLKSLNSKCDPVNVILDRIDAELNNLTRSQSSSGTGSTIINRSNNGNHDRSGGLQSRSVSGGVDTGLGTESHGVDTSLGPGSGHGDTTLDKYINGTAEIYSDAIAVTDNEDVSRKGVPSDLDSIAAQNVDERFKEIMRRKKGSLLENLKKGPIQSDAETIKTEDFEDRFKDTMIHQSDSDTLEFRSRDSDTLTDGDSVNTDNLDWEYFESKPKSNKGNRNGRHHFRSHTVDAYPSRTAMEDPDETSRKCVTPPLQIRKRDGNSVPPMYPRINDFESTTDSRSGRPRQRHKKSYTSDADSIKTEDFEVKFKDLIVKPGEVTDSQGELTDNDPLHAKVKQILQLTAPYRTDEKNDNRDRDRSPSNIDRESGRYSDKDISSNPSPDHQHSKSLW